MTHRNGISRRVQVRVTAAVFLLLGALVIIAGGQVQSPIKDVLVSIGAVFFTVPLVSLMWAFMGGDPLDNRLGELDESIKSLEQSTEIIRDCRMVGVARLIDRSANFGGQQEWINLFETAQHDVDILGRTMFAWIDGTGLDSVIKRRITQDNIKIRWLIMSPENPYIHALEENEPNYSPGIIDAKIKSVRHFLENISSDIPAHLRKNFEVRYFSDVPLYSNMARFDHDYYVIPYLTYQSSRKSPLLMLRGRELPWAAAYQNEFEEIWGRAPP